MHERAYAMLSIKRLDDGERVIEGVASTPEPDRMGDIVEPMGAKFKLPMPLLWQHMHDQPIGHVEFARPTETGIPFRARLVKIEEPGKLKDRLDEAWQSLKSGLVRAVSIGFRALEYSRMENGGLRFLEWEWLELSAVTVPANAEASITSIKSIDRKLLAASGREAAGGRDHPPRARGSKTLNRKEIAMKTIKEQIAELEARRKNIADEMKAFGDVTELDAEKAAEFEELSTELDETDPPLARLRALEKAMDSAKPVRGESRKSAAESRRTIPAEPKSKDLPKGTAFARFAMAVAAGKGSLSDTLEYAKRWDEQTPEVSDHIKAVAGTVADNSPGWGSQLAEPNNLVNEFIELLMPATVVGRIQGFDMVPFNVRIIEQIGGATVNWVGELAPKPVGENEFDEFLLGFNKIAGIVVLSQELVRLSSPRAEEKVRQDLIKQIVKFVDQQFLDSSVTATSARPASVTNGVAGIAASGTDGEAFRYDLNRLLAPFDTAELDLSTLHLVMPGSIARGLSTLTNPLGQKEFPDLNARGGEVDGFPVVVSNSAPASQLVAVVASEIAMADDGSVSLDASTEATLDLSGGDTPTFSLYQRNAVAIRAERGITWKKKRAAAVNRIHTASYGPLPDNSPA